MSSSFDDDAVALGKVLACLPEIVILVDCEGVIQYVNRVEAGYDRNKVLGMRSETLFFPESKDVFEAALRSVLATGKIEELEVEISAPDGSPAWYRSHMSPYRDGDSIVGAIIMATNITELKAAQETVAQLRRLLPICAWCGRIQDEPGNWKSIEAYLEKATSSQVSHGMCPQCYERQVSVLDRQDSAFVEPK